MKSKAPFGPISKHISLQIGDIISDRETDIGIVIAVTKLNYGIYWFSDNVNDSGHPVFFWKNKSSFFFHENCRIVFREEEENNS